MRKDDIFEAMTDIDDRFIEAARPIEHDSPIVAVAAPRRALWKSLVPAAAFVAVVAAAGVVGVNYLRGSEPRISASSSISSSLKEYWYPDEAEFVVDDSISRFNSIYQVVGGSPLFDTIADYAESYDELAKNSDLIVSGTFIDVIHQTSDSKEIWSDADKLQMSYNWFEVESVVKGDINPGSVLTIGQNSTLNSCNEEDGTCNYIVVDQLSPMLKGDKWIYFLKQEENGTFSPVNGPQGRYPLPNYTNRLISWDGETSIVDEFYTEKNAAPVREEIYARVLELLAESAPKVEQIGVPGESFTTFTMPEFPYAEFNVSRLGVTVDDADIFALKEDETLANLILADLNGDGKRELCASITEENGRRRVLVRDFENGVSYTLPETPAEEYALEVVDNALNVIIIANYSVDFIGSTSTPLTFDMLVKEIVYDPNEQLTEVALDTNHTFTLPDFEGFEFNVDTSYDYPQFSFNWHINGSRGSANSVNSVYFSDLDGDGQREIIVNCPFGDLGWLRIYGFMDNGEIGEAEYYENGGCRLVKVDGKLNYENESGEIPFEFSRSDLMPMYAYKYSYELLNWDHQLIYKDIVPASGIFDIRIVDHRLVVTFEGKEVFTSAYDLGELFTFPDAENNRLIFVYSNETTGCIDAFMLSEQPEKLVCLTDANIVNTAHTDYDDDVIFFKDGRSVSINDILACLEND